MIPAIGPTFEDVYPFEERAMIELLAQLPKDCAGLPLSTAELPNASLLAAIRNLQTGSHGKWLTTDEVAGILRLSSRQGVRDTILRGELPATKRGRTRLIHEDDLDGHLRQRTQNQYRAQRGIKARQSTEEDRR